MVDVAYSSRIPMWCGDAANFLLRYIDEYQYKIAS
jgi:hypothetical protein